MVDPNPARGMPLQLQRYWLTGRGAAKIRWNVPGDFLRCVRQLVKYFPKNPKGLCNILHEKATGGPPGHGSAEHAITAASQALMDTQPELGPLWFGPLAPINAPTMEPQNTRVFQAGALSSRSLPMPLDWRKEKTNQGHAGSVTVGRILGVTIGPGPDGKDYLFGFGDWLDPEIIPEVAAARHLVQKGVAGTSLDPGGPVVGEIDPETGFAHMSKYVMGGATLVSIPAFSDMRLVDGEDDSEDGVYGIFEDDYDLEAEADCGCEDTALTAAVNPSGWHGMPIAPREAVFDNDDAIKRITQWASGGGQLDPKLMNQMFMWRDQSQSPHDPTSYRLPIGDIVSGKPTLIYHAIYAAAALLSGAHGGLPNIPDAEKAQLRGVISSIYPEMAKAFNDGNIKAPWDQPADVAAREQGGVTAAMTTPAKPYGDVKYADPGYRDDKKRYPIDTPEHIKAAWSYINVPENAQYYTPKQLKSIKAAIVAAAKKAGIQISEKAKGDMSVDLTYPPSEWFVDPELSAKTPLTVTSEGRVYGHLAAWNECHRDVGMKACVLAPHSAKNYDPFHLGTVFTAEGEAVRVGKIVMDTRHAGINLGYRAAAIHYDDTGDEVAVVRAGEDQFGIWVAGSVVPEADERKIQKLRRSPLSGDWRAVDGNLELTAALAVNVPAFPVFAMDGDERLALVAAGTVYPDHLDSDAEYMEFIEAPDDDEEFTMSEEQEDLAWDMRALIEDHANWNQWRRAKDLYDFAMATGAPNPVDPGPDPLYGDQAVLSRQMDTSAPYHVVEDTGAGTVPTPTAA